MFSQILSVCVFSIMALAIWAVFQYAPTEREMGIVQRIFYFHVPAAMTAFGAFFVVFFFQHCVSEKQIRPLGLPRLGSRRTRRFVLNN